MKNLLLFAGSCLLWAVNMMAQNAESFHVELKEIQFANAPGVQSFVHGQYSGNWLILGGRTDGLHQRQPFASFLAADNNNRIYVLDPVSLQTHSASLNSLPASLYEQLQSTNMNFEQRDSMLYVIGGYGYSASSGNHVTYPHLTAIHLPGVIQAVINGTSLSPWFRQITDTVFQVTGGYLGRLENRYYLAGGQKFQGRYNPMGPNRGPGFVQEYTNAIRSFKILDNGQNLSISDYKEWKDTANLHRRDYNMAYQRFPDGSEGYTIFSGVFQYNMNLPWLNTVDFTAGGFVVRPNFNQYLNQYHTAHLGIFEYQHNAMHTLFFGGISRYTLDASGQLKDDQDVPFVNTISKVSRYANDSMHEYKIGEMPDLLGSGAEFIPVEKTNYFTNQNLLILDSLPYSKTLVGYVVGGIESTLPNIFFINNGTQSNASARVFEVYLTRGSLQEITEIDAGKYFKVELFPNPAKSYSTLRLQCPHSDQLSIELTDSKGKKVQQIFQGQIDRSREFNIPTEQLSSGVYFLRISNPQFYRVISLVVQ